MTTLRRVLIVENDKDLRQILIEQLAINEEFITDAVDSGAAAINLIKSHLYDAILLDIDLPDMDGRDACREIRSHGVKAPVVMLIAEGLGVNRPLALDAGVSDFIKKPFRITALMTRLRAQIRRREQSEEVVFQIGPFSFLPALKLVLDAKNNIKTRLTDKEAEIITFLYLAGGSVVSRDVLLGEVWGYSAGVTTHTLETHVYRLRQKIEPDRTKPIFLMTELNGYRLVL